MPKHSEFEKLDTAVCTCGKTIVWGVNQEGKKIPLDPVPAVYDVAVKDTDGTTWCERNTEAMVLHFVTCPDAGKHSKGKGS